MKLPNTSSSTWPANIAMNGRSPSENGRTMNEMNSTTAISGFRTNGASFGQKKLKKCSLCFQKPTISTIAKLVSDIVPVTENWLVTVNGCPPGTIANGIAPRMLANRMKVKAVNTQGRYLRPSGPIDERVILSQKPT